MSFVSVSGVLKPVEHVTLLPSASSRPWQTQVASSQAIDAVDVCESVKLNGHRYYLVNVSFKAFAGNGGLTNNQHLHSRTAKPTIQIQHRFFEFVDLRYEIYHYARQSHAPNTMPCRFCAKLMEHHILDRAQPGILTKVVNNRDSTIRLLDEFMKKVVRLARCTDASSSTPCAGQKYIPLIVERFLSPPDKYTDP